MRKEDKLGVNLRAHELSMRTWDYGHRKRFVLLNLMYWSRYRLMAFRFLVRDQQHGVNARMHRRWDLEDFKSYAARVRKLNGPRLP